MGMLPRMRPAPVFDGRQHHSASLFRAPMDRLPRETGIGYSSHLGKKEQRGFAGKLEADRRADDGLARRLSELSISRCVTIGGFCSAVAPSVSLRSERTSILAAATTLDQPTCRLRGSTPDHLASYVALALVLLAAMDHACNVRTNSSLGSLPSNVQLAAGQSDNHC